MTEDEAKKAILLHAFNYTSADSPHMKDGFLGMLRPYQELREQSFHEVMAALEVLGPSLSRGEAIDRELIHSLWAICLLARAWGIEPGGMLRRNGLIAPDDVQRLEEWVDIISQAVFFLTGGGRAHEPAFEPYEHYCRTHGYRK